MTQGVFYKGHRIPSKKALKAHVQEDPEHVRLEATSFYGTEYDGPVSEAPPDRSYTVVGPCPYTARRWYATVSWNPRKALWEVK